MTRGAAFSVGIALAVATMAGCAAAPYQARGTYTPGSAAPILRERPSHAWLVRGNERQDLGDGARIEADGDGFRAVSPKQKGGSHVRKLADGDAVVMDEQGHLVAIRSKSGDETHFAPGTASLPPNSDEVLVQESSQPEGVRLEAADTLDVVASYAPGDKVPGQGHVEEDRKIMPLVAGAILLTISYAPAVYVGIASPLTADRALFVPVVGPIVDLVTRPKCTAPAGSDALPVDPCTGETALKVALVAGTVGQAVGIVLLAIGLPAEAVLVKDGPIGLRVGPFGAHGEF